MKDLFRPCDATDHAVVWPQRGRVGGSEPHPNGPVLVQLARAGPEMHRSGSELLCPAARFQPPFQNWKMPYREGFFEGVPPRHSCAHERTGRRISAPVRIVPLPRPASPAATTPYPV